MTETIMSEKDTSEKQPTDEQGQRQQPPEQAAKKKPVKTPMDPVRKWTFTLLALAFLLLSWYLVSERLTPFTSQARVHALVVSYIN